MAEPAGPAPVAGLLLAAGAGRRLGGRPKALLERDGRPLVRRVAEALRAAGCAPVHVVLGAAARRVRARAGLDPDVVLVDNPDWPSGMGSSLRAGLDSLAPTGAGAALVVLVDQPGVGAAAMARVRAAYDSPRSLAAAEYEGRRGHPVLLGAAHFAEVRRRARDDQGARGYLREREGAGEVVRVPCGDVAEPYDIDTPGDLWRLTAPTEG